MTLLEDLEVKSADVQRNEMMPCSPIITDMLPATTATTTATNDDNDDISSDVSPPPVKPDCNVELERLGVVMPPLTPRNAQNPLVERNTHHGSSEELTVDGNTLIRRQHGTDRLATANDTASTSSQAANVSSRRLRPRQLNRISYVQNAVDGSTAAVAAPKRQNVDSSQPSARQNMSCGMVQCEQAVECGGDGAVYLTDDDHDDDDDDDNASHNAAAAAAASDNLGFEASTSPCDDVDVACLI